MFVFNLLRFWLFKKWLDERLCLFCRPIYFIYIAPICWIINLHFTLVVKDDFIITCLLYLWEKRLASWWVLWQRWWLQWGKTAGRDGCDCNLSQLHPKLLWLSGVSNWNTATGTSSHTATVWLFLLFANRLKWTSEKKTFGAQSMQWMTLTPTTHFLKAPQFPSLAQPHPSPHSARANQHIPEACNRWLQGSPWVSWAIGRGLAKVRLGHRGVWDCCDMARSACQYAGGWVACGHVAFTPPPPHQASGPLS